MNSIESLEHLIMTELPTRGVDKIAYWFVAFQELNAPTGARLKQMRPQFDTIKRQQENHVG